MNGANNSGVGTRVLRNEDRRTVLAWQVFFFLLNCFLVVISKGKWTWKYHASTIMEQTITVVLLTVCYRSYKKVSLASYVLLLGAIFFFAKNGIYMIFIALPMIWMAMAYAATYDLRKLTRREEALQTLEMIALWLMGPMLLVMDDGAGKRDRWCRIASMFFLAWGAYSLTAAGLFSSFPVDWMRPVKTLFEQFPHWGILFLAVWHFSGMAVSVLANNQKERVLSVRESLWACVPTLFLACYLSSAFVPQLGRLMMGDHPELQLPAILLLWLTAGALLYWREDRKAPPRNNSALPLSVGLIPLLIILALCLLFIWLSLTDFSKKPAGLGTYQHAFAYDFSLFAQVHILSNLLTTSAVLVFLFWVLRWTKTAKAGARRVLRCVAGTTSWATALTLTINALFLKNYIDRFGWTQARFFDVALYGWAIALCLIWGLVLIARRNKPAPVT